MIPWNLVPLRVCSQSLQTTMFHISCGLRMNVTLRYDKMEWFVINMISMTNPGSQLIHYRTLCPVHRRQHNHRLNPFQELHIQPCILYRCRVCHVDTTSEEPRHSIRMADEDFQSVEIYTFNINIYNLFRVEFIMMTSSNGNIIRVTGPLCGEFTGHRWISPYKGQWCGALMLSLICVWINDWVKPERSL